MLLYQVNVLLLLHRCYRCRVKPCKFTHEAYFNYFMKSIYTDQYIISGNIDFTRLSSRNCEFEIIKRGKTWPKLIPKYWQKCSHACMHAAGHSITLCSRNFQFVKLRQHDMDIFQIYCHSDLT